MWLVGSLAASLSHFFLSSVQSRSASDASKLATAAALVKLIRTVVVVIVNALFVRGLGDFACNMYQRGQHLLSEIKHASY